ncbi:MAG TPA: DUF5666 domain-containing protein [Terriglobia bacterium]|nr:DUF5666 domain-containing protein [Terriglobia bacterium]
MLKKLAVCSLAILFFAALLQAHGNATHLAGTVTAVDGSHVTIQDKAGKSIVVKLDKTTKYLKAKKPVAASDMQVGSRVVIDATMDEKTKTYSAEEIQVGVAAATAAAKPKAAPAHK